MSSPSADDDNNQQQIVNNKYPYYQGIALYKWREASLSDWCTGVWMIHLALDQNLSKHLWVLLYPTVLTALFLNKLSKKIKRSTVKSFPALSHRAEDDLIKKSLHVFSLSCMVQKRGMGSGSLHTMQGCKLSCCAWFWERCVALGTLFNFSICLFSWPWYLHTRYRKRQHVWITIHMKMLKNHRK